MTFQKGISGNPNGRPPKKRTLTDIVERASNGKYSVAGKDVAAKQVVADLLWQVAATGKLKFPDGTERTMDAQEWIGVIKFLYAQIDGPPKAELDITSGGESLLIKLDK